MINIDWATLIIISQLYLIFGLTETRRYSPFGLPIIHHEVYRTWSEWTTWSTCTRTCGGGVRVRTRTCRVIRVFHHVPSLSRACLGETTEYDLCRMQDCPSYSKDFLSYQCSLHNRQMIGNKLIQEWIPYRNNKSPCELQCVSKGNAFWYNFGKVMDGTYCSSPDSDMRAICVNGRCMKIDCADQFGMDNKVDKCGVCRGDNSTCNHFRSSFWSRQRNAHNPETIDSHFDYDLIAEIPKRSMHISVWETSDDNFLALMDEGGKILINGNWQIGSPEVMIHHHQSKITYNRTLNGYEIMSIRGPTTSDFLILVLGKGTIPTVDVEYWLPKDATRPRSQLSKRYKSPLAFENHIWKNRTSKDRNNIKYIVPSQLQYKQDKLIPRTRGYKSFYQRNKIVESDPMYKPYFPKTSSKLPPTTLTIPMTTPTIPGILTTFKGVAFEDKHRYNYYRKQVNAFEEDPSNARRNARNGHYWSRPNTTSSLTGNLPKIVHFISDRSKTTERSKVFRQGFEPSSSVQPMAEELVASTKLERKRQKFTRKKRRQKANEVLCPPCVKVKEENKHFCSSDFVLRVTVQSSEAVNDQRRYEVEVVQSYKNKIAILSKEFLWTPDLCRCPKLRHGQDYIVMGYLKAIKRESQLVIEKDSFVRKYNRKRGRKMQRLLKNQNAKCKNLLEKIK